MASWRVGQVGRKFSNRFGIFDPASGRVAARFDTQDEAEEYFRTAKARARDDAELDHILAWAADHLDETVST